MEKRGFVMMRVLMNRFHKGSEEQILGLLPEEDAATLKNLAIGSEKVEAAFSRPGELFPRMDYSWFVEPLRSIPDEIRPLYFSAFSEKQREKMLAYFSFDPEKIVFLSSSVRQFLQNDFCHKLGVDALLPRSFLPETPLWPLLNCSKSELCSLCDLLGIYDFASEVRQIIDKKSLNRLIGFLSLRQAKFLKAILYRPEKLTYQKLHIDQFRGNQAALRKVLHRRGLIRLSGALAGCHPDFFWYVGRTFDIGRNKILEKHWQEQAEPVTTQAIGQQVLHAFSFLQRDKE